jgi:diguanylate cyclase (GGDEF)-like protein
MGIDYQKIVIEITEATTVEDYAGFEKLIRYYVGEGFYVALDDFGAGHSGLITLVAMTAHFLKLDQGIISDIHLNSYKQNLIKAISSFSTSVEIYMIAEGIEKFEELKTVFRQGVRYGQGYLLGKPEPVPALQHSETRKLLNGLMEDHNHTRFAVDISITKLVSRPYTVQRGTMTCAELDRVFRQNNSMDHVVILENDIPRSLITRQDFYGAIGGRYGFSFFEKRPIEVIITPKMLAVEEQTDLRSLGRFAMNRNHKELYNPVVIVDKQGAFVGTITVKQLLLQAFDMEVKIASYSNPLTELPGNMIISVWLEEAVQKPTFTVVYGDLNSFKEYNDTYGFTRGDDMIKLAARVLQKNFIPLGNDVRLGHIGGDDFIIIAERAIPEYVYENVCREFDESKQEFFIDEHREAGYYVATNRQGEPVPTPLVSLSLAVVTERNFTVAPHPVRLSEISSLLKKKIKSINNEQPKSAYLEERRKYDL